MKAKIHDFVVKRDGTQLLTLELTEPIENLVDAMGASEVDFTMKKYRQKRSLSANAYAWVLIGKIAEKTNIPVDDVYREYIRNLGGNYETVCCRTDSADAFQRAWEQNGLGWITDSFPSKVKGCTNIRCFYGSSTYDTDTMRRLIDHIVQDCGNIGIDTATPDEIANMMSLWQNS